MANSRKNGRPYPKLVFGETLSVAVQTFRTNKMRFILTALGMVIGTASLILRSEEHTSELQSLRHLVCRLLLEKKNKTKKSREERSSGKHTRNDTSTQRSG